MPVVNIDDAKVYYEIHGEGEPLILIPGLGTGLWLWFKQVPAFAESFRTIIFDPPGVGRSSTSEGTFTTRSLASTVAELLDTLGIDRAHILGASLGGFVAQEFALAHPRKTQSLVLCCTSAGGARHVPPAASILEAYAANFKLNAETRIRQNLLLSFAPQYVAEHEEEVEQVLAMRLNNFVSDEAYQSQVRAGQMHDADARVSQITARTLIITGDADRIVPMENSVNMAAAIPHAKLTVIPGGSHMFFIEKAADFNAAVIEFLQQASSSDI
ncbi:MAG: alpha/beta hydrolase [Pyrinomonadaceae bacterium]